MHRRWQPDSNSSAWDGAEGSPPSCPPQEWEAVLGVARQAVTRQKERLYELSALIEANSEADSVSSTPIDLRPGSLEMHSPLESSDACQAEVLQLRRELEELRNEIRLMKSSVDCDQSAGDAAGGPVDMIAGERVSSSSSNGPSARRSSSFSFTAAVGGSAALTEDAESVDEELFEELTWGTVRPLHEPLPGDTCQTREDLAIDCSRRLGAGNECPQRVSSREDLHFGLVPRSRTSSVCTVLNFEPSESCETAFDLHQGTARALLQPSNEARVSTTHSVRQPTLGSGNVMPTPADTRPPKCQTVHAARHVVAATPVLDLDAGVPTANLVPPAIDDAVRRPRLASESIATTPSLVIAIDSMMSPALDSPPSNHLSGSIAPHMDLGSQIGSDSRAWPPMLGQSPEPSLQQLPVVEQPPPTPQLLTTEQPHASVRLARRNLSPLPRGRPFHPPPGATAQRSPLRQSMCGTAMSDGGQPTSGSASHQRQRSPPLMRQQLGSRPSAGNSHSTAAEQLNQILTRHLKNLGDVSASNSKYWRSRSTSPVDMQCFVPTQSLHVPFDSSPKPSRSSKQAVPMSRIASPASPIAAPPSSFRATGSTAASAEQASSVSLVAEVEKKMARLRDVAADVMRMRQESGDVARALTEEIMLVKQNLGDSEQAWIEEHLGVLHGLLRSELFQGCSSTAQPQPASVAGIPGVATPIHAASTARQHPEHLSVDCSRTIPDVPLCLYDTPTSSAAISGTPAAPTRGGQVTLLRAGPIRRSQSPHREVGAVASALPVQQLRNHELSLQPPSGLACISATVAPADTCVLAQNHQFASPSLSSTADSVRSNSVSVRAPATSGTGRPLALGVHKQCSASIFAAPTPNSGPLVWQRSRTPVRDQGAAINGTPCQAVAANPGFERSCHTGFQMPSAAVAQNYGKNPQPDHSSSSRQVQSIQ